MVDRLTTRDVNDILTKTHGGGDIVIPLGEHISDEQQVVDFMRSVCRTVKHLEITQRDLGELNVEINQLLQRLGVTTQEGSTILSRFKLLYIAIDALLRDTNISTRNKNLEDTTIKKNGI